MTIAGGVARQSSRLARESIMKAANYVRVFHSNPLSVVLWMVSVKAVGDEGDGGVGWEVAIKLFSSATVAITTTAKITMHKPRNMFLMQTTLVGVARPR